MDKDPNLVHSSLSGNIIEEGVTLEVFIYRLEHVLEWSLEVVLTDGTSVVWDDIFPTDTAAFAEFQRTVSEDGISSIVGNVIQFPGKR